MTEGPRVEAIDRALSLLTALSQAGPKGAPLTELAVATGVNKSTAYRALSTMRAHGFVTQSASTGDYRLGAAAMALGEQFLTPQSLVQSLHPALVALSREADELVHLGILNGDRVIYVDKVESDKAIRVWSQVGRNASAATTSLGRAILAYRPIPDDHLDAYAPSEAAAAQLRDAVAAAARQLAGSVAAEAAFCLAEIELPKRDLAWRLAQAAQILQDSTYRCDELKSKKDESKKGVRKLTFVVKNKAGEQHDDNDDHRNRRALVLH